MDESSNQRITRTGTRPDPTNTNKANNSQQRHTSKCEKESAIASQPPVSYESNDRLKRILLQQGSSIRDDGRGLGLIQKSLVVSKSKGIRSVKKQIQDGSNNDYDHIALLSSMVRPSSVGRPLPPVRNFCRRRRRCRRKVPVSIVERHGARSRLRRPAEQHG